MPLTGAHPAETRAAALRLLRETDLSIAAIAARVGASARTVWHWNVRAGWARPPRRRWMLTARWPAARRAALLRLLGASGADPADIAEVLGLDRPGPEALVWAFGPALAPAVRARLDQPPADPAALRAQLCGHIARQIATFDAALSRGTPALRDSARVLRDLGGLKRLLDTVGAEGGRNGAGEGSDDGTEPDLPALRAEIARRYAGFVGDRASA
jgi:AcrR family transcriptional regulator